MFIFKLTYKKPLAEVEKYLQAHREYLDSFYKSGKFIASGPQEPRVGGVILCNTNDLEEATKIYQTDPFFINDIADYDLTYFHATKHSKDNFADSLE